MRPSLPVICILLVLASLPHAPAAAEGVGDWTVAQDTELRQADKTVPGTVRVAAGATLRLAGSTLQVGEALVVEEGGRLEMAPLGGRAAIIRPAALRFYITIEGAMETSGLPRSLIEGLDGPQDGWSVAAGQDRGGLRINGTAVLDGFELRDSVVGIVTGRESTLQMTDGLIHGTGAFGIVSYGNTTLRSIKISDVGIALFGRGGAHPCRLAVADADLEGQGGHIQTNSCNLEAARMRLRGGSSAMFLNGGTASLTDTHVFGYANHGLHAEGAIRLVLRNVTFDGLDAGKDGLDIMAGADVTLEGVTIRGHRGNGVTGQAGTVRVLDATILGNGGSGIQLVSGRLEGWENGTYTAPPNGGVPVAWIAYAMVRLWDGDAPAEGADLKISDLNGNIVFNGTSGPSGSVQVAFNTVGHEQDEPKALGPFRYQAAYAGIASAEGTFDPVMARLDVHLVPQSPPDPVSAPSLEEVDVQAPAPAMALVLLALAFAASLRSRFADVSP
ncbi:MAG: hypothetical protein QOD77_1752 [Thermoplasmata archaeon]|jgi:hypothetical protein|nr:hypothetical protein [Thermoplasmata archaeon]